MYEKKVEEIALTRDQLEKAKLELNNFMEKIYSDEKYKALSLAVQELKAQLDNETNSLKSNVETEFINSGEKNKHPHPAITIKEVIKIQIDEKEARNYCFENMKSALKLDTTKFKNMVKIMEEEDRPDCVSIDKEPSATLKQDLSEYLK